MDDKERERKLSLRQKRIRRQTALVKLEEHLRRGVTNQTELAAAFGVSQPTISRWISIIYDQWLRQDPERAQQERQLRVRQLEGIAHQALIDYERSRENEEEISTTYTPKKCPRCSGSGMDSQDDEEWCPKCEGEGEIQEQTIHRRVRGKAGDVNFLRAAKECFVECAKLKALYPHTKSIGPHVQVNQIVNSQTLDLTNVSSEDLLAAKEALARLQMNPMKQIEGRVIERD